MEKLGTLEIKPLKGADPTISASVEFNSIAVHGGELMFVSAVGSDASFKVMQAVANSGGSIPAMWVASGLEVLTPSSAKFNRKYPQMPGRLMVSGQGYNVHKHRLGFGQEHRLFVSRRSGFMLVATPEAIWMELKSNSFSTPILRPWLTYITEQLTERRLLVECKVHPYEESEDSTAPILGCKVISASTKDLDDIVLAGLRSGRITISHETEAKHEVAV